MTAPLVRALYGSAAVPGAAAPYDRITLKVYYPARYTGADSERMSGVLPAWTEGVPFPVMIFLPGINIGMDAYGWLALELGKAGIVTVLMSWIAETLPGIVGLTPGVDLTAVMPDAYGTRPTSPAIRPILAELARLNTSGLLEGKLDLNKVILAGHSAGGTMALQNARADYFPQVCAAVTYAGHMLPAAMFGYAPGMVLPCSDEMPLLVMGGTDDGVIAASRARYAEAEFADDPVVRTFREGVAGARGDRYLVMLAGANHFAFVGSDDPAMGRGFLETTPVRPSADVLAALSGLIRSFIDTHVRKNEGARVDTKNTLFAMVERK